MTPVEVNEAVARKLGWESSLTPAQKFMMGDAKLFVPNYCGKIAAAWEIIDLQKEKLISIARPGSEWICRIIDVYNSDEVSEGASTAPMAICLAFLKLP